MSCSEFLHFEEGYIEDDYMRTYECTIIKEANLKEELIHLQPGILEYHPVTDIYTEIRYMRANDTTLRVVDAFVTAQGNVDKGGGRFTSRLAVYRDPWVIVPNPTDTKLKVSGEQISSIGTSGVDLMSFDAQQVPIAVEYAPADTEIVQLSTGGLTGTQALMLQQMFERLDLDVAKPNTYAADGSKISNGDWSLDKIPSGNNFTIQRS